MREKFASLLALSLAFTSLTASAQTRVKLGMIETDNPAFPAEPILAVVNERNEIQAIEFVESDKLRYFSVEQLKDEPTLKVKIGIPVVRASFNSEFDAAKGGLVNFKFRANMMGTKWLKQTRHISPDSSGEWKVWCGENPCERLMINFDGNMFPQRMGFE